jgi:hypothetical protein
MKTMIMSLIIGLGLSASAFAADSLECQSLPSKAGQPFPSKGDLTIKLNGPIFPYQYLKVDGSQFQISWGGRPVVVPLSLYFNADTIDASVFVIFEPSDTLQRFHLEVNGSSYTITRKEEGNPDIILEQGDIACRSY